MSRALLAEAYVLHSSEAAFEALRTSPVTLEVVIVVSCKLLQATEPLGTDAGARMKHPTVAAHLLLLLALVVVCHHGLLRLLIQSLPSFHCQRAGHSGTKTEGAGPGRQADLFDSDSDRTDT